jgi:valyl-tRNA synthetase
MESKYNPLDKEDKWYKYWMDNELFKSTPDHREPYTIVIPPPNVTGVLHMGHMLNNTIQDILIRRARMQGKNACWVPGTDHASIATEAKVVQMLRERGIKKSDISREEFLKYAFEWKDKYGGIILEQLKKLGASCDWSRTRFTMEDDLSEAVIDCFIDLYKKGLIYRDLRMINWDPQALTVLSNEEVLHTEENSKLFYVQYKLVSGDGFLTVATVRPETIMGDVAIAVNPRDERYKLLIGQKVIVPFVNREVPIIADDYVDLEFGTGCLKVTPAHDTNDYEIGKRHGLEVIDCFNQDGTISEAAGYFIGLDRFKARKEAAKELEESGLLLKTEDIQNKVGRSERTNAIIEPRLSLQWFVDMKQFFEKNPQVLEDVMSDEIAFHPARYKNSYKNWIDNIRDWCVSRQLWWGQRIPAWYLADGEFAVAKTKEEAIAQFRAKGLSFSENEVKQDDDVLDTWFSSWLWPISVFDGLKDPNNADIKYYYPTNDLVTAPEIMFFWVMRMIMAGYEWRGEKPFKNVYYTGIVRDKQRRKMSKSLGNSPNPLDLIAQYGADGVRLGMMLCSPAGNDILFDEKLCEQGRNFSNKLWNALRLIKGWEVNDQSQPAVCATANSWFEAKFAIAVGEIEEHFASFRISDALMTLYKLVWDDFCSWYLEMIKPDYQQPIDSKTVGDAVANFEKLAQLLHPFMPFITEELWFNLNERKDGESISITSYPTVKELSASAKSLLQEGELAIEIITAIREIRAKAQKKNHETVDCFYKGEYEVEIDAMKAVIAKLAKVNVFEKTATSDAGVPFIVKGYEFAVITGVETKTDPKQLEQELNYTQGFLESIDKKLANEKFVANAKPEIIENERKKRDDAIAKINALKEALGN